MSRINLRIITGLLIIIGLAAIVVAYYIYPLETLADQTAFVVTVVSLVVSFLAFIIATLTYTSIDSVDTVTRMEGNVLENEYYVISLTDIFDKYNIQNPREIEDAIFKDLHNRFKRESKTAVEFANNLQHFIDLIVIFPLLYKGGTEKKKNIERIEALLDQIIRRKNKLTEISRGTLTLIEETVKLITAVMKYQQLIAIEKTDNTIPLLSVRGSMLKNAVTKTVYYNYLGLFYNKKGDETHP